MSPAWVEERAVDAGSSDTAVEDSTTADGPSASNDEGGEGGGAWVAVDAPYDMSRLRGSMAEDERVVSSAATARARFAASKTNAVQVRSITSRTRTAPTVYRDTPVPLQSPLKALQYL